MKIKINLLHQGYVERRVGCRESLRGGWGSVQHEFNVKLRCIQYRITVDPITLIIPGNIRFK